jgi:hypothetical protein
MRNLILFLLMLSSLDIWGQPNMSIDDTKAYLTKIIEENQNALEGEGSRDIRNIEFQFGSSSVKKVTWNTNYLYSVRKCSFDIRKVSFSEVKVMPNPDWNSFTLVSKQEDSNINVDSRSRKEYRISSLDRNTLVKIRNAFVHLQNLILEEAPLTSADVDPFLNYEIKPKEMPRITITATSLADDSDNQIIEDNEAAILKVSIRNMGQQSVENIKMELIPKHQNRGISSESSQTVYTLMPEANAELNFRIAANDQVKTGIVNFELILTLDGKKYAKKDIELSTFNRGLETVKFASLPDVDINIPSTVRRQPNKFALVVGNENYTTAPAVPFAKRDAKIFADYLAKTLGIPAENIFLEYDLTKAAFDSRIKRIALIPQVNPDAEIIFYYAGHGLPSFETKEQYLIPTDVNESNLKNGIKFNELISSLNANEPKSLLILADACFSGGARTENLLSGRSVRVKPKENHLSANTLILSASSNDQMAKAFFDKKHGLFTYYILLKLQSSKGKVTAVELFDFVKTNVSEKSILINGSLQTPSFRHGQGVEFIDFNL